MMTRGEELLQAIKGVRNFLGDLSKLLVACDTAMDERSWKPVGRDPNCLFWLSYSVHSGHQWMPRVAWRRYVDKPEFPCVVAAVSLLLDDHGLDFRLSQPVVSGSYFVFPEGTTDDKVWVDYWNACWFGWLSAPLDGTAITVDQHYPSWKPAWGWTYSQVFGRPLVEVTSQALLQEMIIDPLLKLIQQHGKTGPGP